MALDRNELLDHVTEQRDFLASSCAAFDRGERHEAKRIAVAVRVLVHDTNASHSLLGQLDAVDRHAFPCVNKSAVDESAFVATGTMTAMRITATGAEAVAKTDVTGRELPFDQWWNELLAKGTDFALTRRSVVLALTNQGGGAHVDRRPGNHYRGFAEGTTVGWEVNRDGVQAAGKDIDLNNPLPEIQRGIGAEMLEFIDRILSDA